MATFPNFPCFCSTKGPKSIEAIFKHLDDVYNFKAELMFQYTFRDFIHHINDKSNECMFIDPANHQNDPDITDREWNMKCTVYKLLKESYKKDPSPVKLEKIQDINDIGPLLQENLSRILQGILHALDDPWDVLAGKSSYQRLVLECFLFAAKLASQYMDAFPYEMDKIFDEVIRLLEEFFESQNVFHWVQHCGHVLEPFGKLESNEPSSDEDFLCYY